MSRRWPLSARLGISGALVAAVSCALLGAHLYLSFEQQLLRRDDVQLLGKLRQLRQVLSHSGTPALLYTQADYLRDTMSGESNALIEIFASPDKRAQLLLSINPSGLPLATHAPLEIQKEPELRDIQHWTVAPGIPAAGINGLARLGTEEVEVRVARLYPDRQKLLADYRFRIAAASLGAGGFAAVLVILMIWQGLSPLRRLCAQAASIGPSNLGQRMHESDVPPELRSLVQGINGMLSRIEQGYVKLNQFAADLSHELRTPLATMTGQSQVILSQPRTEAEYVRLQEAQLDELERLNRTVDSLLFLARTEHGVAPSEWPRQSLSAADEMSRQIDYFTDLAEEQGVLLKQEGDTQVWAEPQLLRRALANLVQNAVRHARPGSEIILRSYEDIADGVCFTVLEVANDGDPVPSDELPRLFDRFYRADNSRSGVTGGSGLGLAIVNAIAKLHGGDAKVRNAENGQIIFSIHLPAIA
ncbi:heavy metal sensor histidine kinase [Cupriavidus pauculus]|jgi:two-component system, OmpR family, heavy metal sensor histidine kinase CusS|uniref:heavy metal sensor histidine kinase n=1 Tax=Cupriavidus pauculus TaxID=82633 RepID=UPI001D0C294E|nr:heavy metal sensor histidine kinase [Cupriavidus pauculus]